MYLYLLEASVTVDVNKLPIPHLLMIVLPFFALAAIVLIIGLSLKSGDKEINIGGVQRLLAKRDKDTLLKESLKKFTDDVDHEVEANLFDLVKNLEDRLGPPLIQGDHCYFTFNKFSSIVKSELYSRIRRNNLWEKLSDAGKDRYINSILKEIEERYALLQARANLVKCGDTYAEFKDIRGAVRGVLGDFFDGAAEILVVGMKKKIEKYKETKPEFKTAEAKKFCCDDCIAKNQSRIDKLAGMGTIGGKNA